MTVAHPLDVHARTRCVISDCLSGFAGGRGRGRGLLGGLDAEGEVGAPCIGIGAPSRERVRVTETHRVRVHTCDSTGWFLM